VAAHLLGAARQLARVTLTVALQAHLRDGGGARRWVYLGEDTGWRISAERGALAGVERVATGASIERLARELRRPYIDLVGDLSRRNASIEWWASDLAAKNPFAMLFPRVCALGCARELIAQGLDDAVLVCSTRGLADAVAEEARRAGVPVRFAPAPLSARARAAVSERRGAVRPAIDAWARAAPDALLAASLRLGGAAASALEDAPAYRERLARRLGIGREGDFGGTGTTLLFTWADQRSLAEDGSYRDPHFGTLPDLLEGRGERLGYVPRVLPGAPLEEVLGGLARSGARVFAPEAWLDSSDWRDAHARAGAFSPAIPADAAVADVPFARLAHEHVEQLRFAQGWALAHASLVRNLAETGVRPERLVLPFEGHSWEQVVTAAAHEHMPGTRVIGYDNVNFSSLALSLYPAASELGLRPLPDRVVTNGPAFARTLAGEGFPKERIRVGCGLRHEYVWAERGEPRARPDGAPQRVLAAGSIDAGQSVELIEKAVSAFGGDGFELVMKLHPAVDRAAVQARLSPAARAARFSETPIGELLGAADVLLYAYSVVCYEALAQGVAPVFVKSETFLDLDQLEPFPELGWRARTVEELRTAAAEIAMLGEEERARWRERARAALADALRPVDPGCADAFTGP
jgi:hypothetical protein